METWAAATCGDSGRFVDEPDRSGFGRPANERTAAFRLLLRCHQPTKKW